MTILLYAKYAPDNALAFPSQAELRGKQGGHLDLTPVLTEEDFDNFPSLKDWGFTAEELESIKQAYVGQPLPLRKGFKLPELTTTQECDDWAETYISNIFSVS